MRRRAADAEDERLCKLLRGRLLQGHACAACVCSGAELHGGGCACALDAPAAAVARDPWDLAGAAVEQQRHSLALGQGAPLLRKSAALRAAERDAVAHGWRCIFVKEDANATAPRARVRGTPSGRWRADGRAAELTGAPACAGMACARYAFEPRPGISLAMPQAAASWELRQYREATRREGACDTDADAPPPAHLLLCCVRRRDHHAPETPHPSETDEADEADEAMFLGDVPAFSSGS